MNSTAQRQPMPEVGDKVRQYYDPPSNPNNWPCWGVVMFSSEDVVLVKRWIPGYGHVWELLEHIRWHMFRNSGFYQHKPKRKQRKAKQ